MEARAYTLDQFMRKIYLLLGIPLIAIGVAGLHVALAVVFLYVGLLAPPRL